MKPTFKERPILFNSEMVRAILEGRKTQTRRIIKLQPEHPSFGKNHTLALDDENIDLFLHSAVLAKSIRFPYGKVGDCLVPAFPLPGYDNRYCVDVFGRVWSRAQNDWKVLSPGITSKGYCSITPARDGKYTTQLVHRLVCEAFYGKARNGLNQVRHLNGDQTDNSPENLDWGTQEQNWCDRAAHGKGMGESHHAAKLSQDKVDAIRSSTLSQRRLASIYEVAQSLIQCVKAGEIWTSNREPAPVNMPRWVSRIQLEITEIRVERLNDMPWKDVEREGLGRPLDYRYAVSDIFKPLWESINGEGSWDLNPWVWVIEFKRITS